MSIITQSTIHYTPVSYTARASRMPTPNRHISGQGRFRTPQKSS
ncbi:hypothetical protein [Vibrio kyushuensis]